MNSIFEDANAFTTREPFRKKGNMMELRKSSSMFTDFYHEENVKKSADPVLLDFVSDKQNKYNYLKTRQHPLK